MKRILINSKSGEETRIATLDNGKLVDLSIESIDREQKKANIYKGYISRIEPSLNAIFVNYGEEKNGFLPFKEVSENYLKDVPNGENISHLLSEGQELIVQIDKEERGDKGAALTTFITLAGSYIVLLPNNPNGGGISRRIEGEDRERLKQYLKDLNIPKNMSVIARTACVECSFEELKHDFDNLIELWESIYSAYQKINKPALLHKESDLIVRTIRDNLKEDVKEIIVDSKECFEDVKRQLSLLRQGFDINKVKLYDEELPLFAHYGIDQQIENAYKREIRLPSGGSIVIDTTEALVAIDVNSSRANKEEDVETTAFKTNLEAAEEIARQLRIRDLGGLVVIDFIDMSNYQNRKQVEEKLMEVLQQDRARIQMSRISKLGLVEISRQRLSSSINESVMQKCPRCEGHGFIKTTQATALSIIRKIRAEAIKEDTNEIRVQVPVDIAAYLLNEKRDSIVEIERISNIKIMIIPNFNMQSPKFQIQRIWGPSYKSNRNSSDLIEDFSDIEIPKSATKKEVAITNKSNEKNSNQIDNNKKTKQGLFAKILGNIFAKNNTKNSDSSKKENKHKQPENIQKAKKQNDKNNKRNKNEYKNKNNTNLKQKEKAQNNKYNSNKDKLDTKSNNTQNKNKNNNLTLNNAEEVIDITKLKYQNKNNTPTVDSFKKVISKNPDELISVMVKDILENYDNLKDDGAVQIVTKEKVNTNKYLTFDIVSVDHAINTLSELDKSSNSTEGEQKNLTEVDEPKSDTYKAETQFTEVITEQESNTDQEDNKDTKNTKDKEKNKKDNTNTNKENTDKENSIEKNTKKKKVKIEYINYSPAIDFESQSII